MLHQRKKALVNQAPSTHDPKRHGRASKGRLAGVKSCNSLEAPGMSGLLFGC
jgi:hypothetical protein